MVPVGGQAGHRRMSSLRSTTLNFFKGNNKGSQLQHSTSLRRNELTINSQLPITEENVSPTTTGPPNRADTEPTLPEKTMSRHHFSSTGVFEVGFGRGPPPLPASKRESSSAGGDDEDGNGSTTTIGVDAREMSPSRQSEFDSMEERLGSATTQSARGKKRGQKLKMALSLLRRRSNTNLRRAYGDSVDGNSETSRDQEAFFEPLLDPDYIEPAPSPTRATVTPSGQLNQPKTNGFKFALAPRSHARQVLTKAPPQPPPDNRRPRRATVASVIFDPPGDPERPRNSIWSGRPSSSQSGILKGMPQEEGGMSNGSLVNPDGTLVNGTATPGGGLFPRPASLQRHWSDGAQNNHGTASIMDRSGVSTPCLNQDPVGPLGFGPMFNGYGGSMKITEAVSLETRVQELETQVATLHNFITQHVEFPLQPRRAFSTGAPTNRELVLLRPPHDDRKFSKRSFSLSSAGSSERLGSPELPSTPRNLCPPPRSADQRVPQYSPRTEQEREETLQVLEGFRVNSESKRNTASTIKGPTPMRDNLIEARSPSPTPIVSVAQYAGLVSQVKREQRARRKLEAQIANLQEQMSLVLHRQLLQSSASPTIADAMSLRPGDFSSIRRKTSSEVPTPDPTPPRASPVSNLFTGFDSSMVDDDDSDDESVFMGLDADENEIWETPAEERESMISDSDSDRGFRETLSASPNPQRTLSLSQLTHKSSLAR
ncbi:unnamed protein product [Tuber aestivum]|uniref:Uncharacterized protein n=1 Tax=Tuber aestivum TaxID=59557 RepID=A0A292Q5X6_9PEZI|nr:unnamed protein product [Tuber aestivum]